jgi:hypothetical protein
LKTLDLIIFIESSFVIYKFLYSSFSFSISLSSFSFSLSSYSFSLSLSSFSFSLSLSSFSLSSFKRLCDHVPSISSSSHLQLNKSFPSLFLFLVTNVCYHCRYILYHSSKRLTFVTCRSPIYHQTFLSLINN